MVQEHCRQGTDPSKDPGSVCFRGSRPHAPGVDRVPAESRMWNVSRFPRASFVFRKNFDQGNPQIEKDFLQGVVSFHDVPTNLVSQVRVGAKSALSILH